MKADNNIYTDYDKFYLDGKNVEKTTYLRRAKGFRKKLSGLLEGSRDRKILDIGCGVGYLLFFLQSQGFKSLVGIDANEQLTSIASSNTDAKLHVGDAGEFLRRDCEVYDIIFLWNVLEHIPREQTVEFLAKLHEHLAAKGFVVIRTPNMTNILSQGHLHTDFTHCTGFTEHNLKQVAELVGFPGVEMMNQFRMQTFKGKIKAVMNWCLHKYLLWLRGGARSTVFYRNLYAVLRK